jgi:hypothetical protein
MLTDIEKYFEKTSKNLWSTWNDYELKGPIKGEMEWYLTATIHCPIGTFLNSNRFEHKIYKIILHRRFDRSSFDRDIEDNSSTLVYQGLIENNEDLKFLLYKLGIVGKPIE